MIDYTKLLSIAQKLGVQSDIAEATKLAARAENKNVPLVLPLVGEFSAGKTTLVNALIDSKVLETATEPTTATIYEIHFGATEASATVIDTEGNQTPADIHNLKNADLKDAFQVVLNDTSKLVPPSIVLVDTPGLSSPNPKHRQVLADFMPAADGILLVVDVNLQYTRSLGDFVIIKDMKLANRPVFLIVTKCDTKTESECEATREYIAKKTDIPVSNIACVSAGKGQLGELTKLLDKVQGEKAKIQHGVDAVRAKALAERMSAYIDDLLKAAQSDKEVEQGLRQAQADLNSVQHDVDCVARDAKDDLSQAADEARRSFEREVSSRLNAIAAQKGINYDQEAFSAVNTTASLVMNQFRSKAESIVSAACSKSLAKGQLMLSSAQPVDLSCVQSQGFSYNIDINTAGHENDAAIGKGIAIVAAAAVVFATAGAAAPPTAPAAGAAATTIGSSTAVEVAEVAYMAHQTNKMAKMQKQISVPSCHRSCHPRCHHQRRPPPRQRHHRGPRRPRD